MSEEQLLRVLLLLKVILTKGIGKDERRKINLYNPLSYIVMVVFMSYFFFKEGFKAAKSVFKDMISY